MEPTPTSDIGPLLKRYVELGGGHFEIVRSRQGSHSASQDSDCLPLSKRYGRTGHCNFPYSALACFRIGCHGSGVFQCEVWSRCARNLFWHSFAADSNLL